MALAILDIDGTLVDTNYQHAIAWYRAFRDHGIQLAVWRIHRHIGMGGDQVVQALTDEDTENEKGDAIRDSEKDHYMSLIEEVSVMRHARKLIESVKERGHTVVLASSAKEDEVEYYLDLLEARDLADDWTTSADVEETKPQPDLVTAALKKAGADAKNAVMIGDTPWDIRAAASADVPTVAVLTGGFSIDELKDSGAASVYETIGDLCDDLDNTRLS